MKFLLHGKMRRSTVSKSSEIKKIALGVLKSKKQRGLPARNSAFFGFLFLFLSQTTQAQFLEQSGLNCQFVYPIEQIFLRHHVLIKNRDEQLKQRLIDQYIKRLDPTKIFFTQADVKKLQESLAKVYVGAKARDCGGLNEVQSLYRERVKERVEFAKAFLGEKYKLDEKAEFELEFDKKPWPQDKAAIEDFLKKYIHFQIANYLATDTPLAEAKTNVQKNYDRILKRTLEKKQQDIFADYLDSFARSLDPHSSFFSPDVQEDFNIQMSLSLEGIGATLSSQDGFTVIEALVPGGAAARSGLVLPQDKIVAVDKDNSGKFENIIEMDLRDVVARIRGKKGTKVRLSILRKSGDKKERLEVTLVRDKIKLEDEAARLSLLDRDVKGQKKKVALINLPSFYAGQGRSSAEDVRKLVLEAVQKKAEAMVLDLSTNGGGSLEDAVKLAGLFFKTGHVVKQSDLDSSKGDLPYSDTNPSVDFAGPLVILTSGASASASEIVAGTLKDYRRAIIVGGEHTFGKGSIQTVRPIPQDLGAFKVTVGMFFTPGGDSTQHRGVPADIVIPNSWDGEEFGEKYLDYSLPPKKIQPFVSKEAFVTSGPGAWKEINKDWIEKLKEKSQVRVAASEDFKKLKTDIEKAKARGKIIKVSDILKEKDEKGKKEKKEKALKVASAEEKEKEYLKRPDVNEAVNVALDLLAVVAGK